MSSLKSTLCFSLPSLGSAATAEISLRRTLRLPDDGSTQWLPPGLGSFPIARVGNSQLVPIHPAEALWLNFSATHPCVLQIGAGRLNAVSGLPLKSGICGEPQDYVVLPLQPWLDGFKTEDGSVRQFVSTPLGKGLSAEEQLLDDPASGGITIAVIPIKSSWLEKWEKAGLTKHCSWVPPPNGFLYCSVTSDFGLGGGARIRQEISKDPLGVEAWDIAATQHTTLELVAPERWTALTGLSAPPPPQVAADYAEAGGTFFDYQGNTPSIPATVPLAALKGVTEVSSEGTALAATPALPEMIKTVQIGPKADTKICGETAS